MNLKSVPLLLLPAVFTLVMVACGGTPQPTPAPTPDIEATVEARVAEERAKAAEATATPMIEATVQPVLLTSQGRIAFVSDRDGDHEIYVMNADGSDQTRLTDNDACDQLPVWSPDGSRIAFVSDRDGDLNRVRGRGEGPTIKVIVRPGSIDGRGVQT